MVGDQRKQPAIGEVEIPHRLKGLEWLVPGFVAALVGVWYTGGTAVWDDHRIIEQGLRDVDFDVVQSIWASPVGGGEVGRQYYRPMAYTIMALVYQFGFVGLHVAAVICHAISEG